MNRTMSGKSFMSQYEDTILSMSKSEENEIFRFYFVKKDDGMTNSMRLAYEATKERFSDPESTVIMTNEECFNQPKSALKEKRKYYIFDDFDESNAAFKYISDMKTVYLLGTRALLSILVEHIKTTSGSYQMHNLSMRGLMIASTNLEKEKKLRMKKLISYMGGYYSEALIDGCTHLISETVRTVKYEVASLNNLKVMHPNWVEKVWEKSQLSGNVPANDDEYDCFRLPVFNGLCFTSTGLTVKERNQLKILIEENGGHYNASFNSTVDMLLMEEKSIGSEKYNHAIRLKRICLTPAWVHDSIKNGYALRIENYQHLEEKPSVAKPNKVSTPTKTNATIVKFYPEDTMLSDISRVTIFQRDISINETMATIAPSTSKARLREVPPADCDKSVVQQISLQAAKKVGNILDGYSFYMIGFSVDDQLLLGRILNVLGAVKVDSLGHQVSHILVSEVNEKVIKDLNKIGSEFPILKVDWIKEMIKAKKIISEDAFIVENRVRQSATVDKPSPASKKAIKSLSGIFKKPAIPKLDLENEDDVEENVQMVNQYLNPSNVLESSKNNSCDVKLLTGKNVFVYGCSSTEESIEIIGKVEELGATLVDATFKHTVDYIITPDVSASKLDHGIKKFKHLVNMVWLVESAEAGCICDVLFYHKPLVEHTFGPDDLPLKNEKIAVTNYKGNARNHIKHLVIALGGEYSETLRRSDNPILVAPNSEGKKCQSAKDWNSTILKAEWLVECYERRRRVNEIPFLLGGTNPSNKNIQHDDSIVLSSQDVIVDSDQFDSFDPQIENFDEDDNQTTPTNRLIERVKHMEAGTPKPVSPNTAAFGPFVSKILKEMPTPVREITRTVFLEADAKKSGSPRKKRYQEILTTPENANKSFAMNTPELLRAPVGIYSFRPDSSPDSQWHHKRKIEGLDHNHIPRTKKSKFEDYKQETPTPPFSHRRYKFYKSRIPEYDSPDPRPSTSNNCKKPETSSDANKFLNFEDDCGIEVARDNEDNQTLKEFQEFEQRKQLRNEQKHEPKKLLKIVEFSSNNTEQIHPIESEALVEWNYTQHTEEKNKDQVNAFTFALNGLDPEEKDFALQELSNLGCVYDPENYSHLITKCPNRGEKYLSSMAAGGFVIHENYVTQCAAAGYLIELEPFEFGNPKFKASLKKSIEENFTEMSEILFNAPYKWRKWIKDEEQERFKDGAFTGMTFTIIESKGNPSLFSKVLKKGGGKYVEIDFDKVSTSMLKGKKIDYCLVDNRGKLNKDREAKLKECRIRIVNVKFINDFLSSSDAPNLKSS